MAITPIKFDPSKPLTIKPVFVGIAKYLITAYVPCANDPTKWCKHGPVGDGSTEDFKVDVFELPPSQLSPKMLFRLNASMSIPGSSGDVSASLSFAPATPSATPVQSATIASGGFVTVVIDAVLEQQ